ncbi:MAG: histidine kinase [Chitinophagaceae bacterium]|nr:histidine kinase [Chitinophagaceae bacterium]
MRHEILVQAGCMISFSVLLAASLYLLSVYNRLFTGVKNAWLRQNLSVLVIGMLGMAAFIALEFPSLLMRTDHAGVWGIVVKRIFQSAIIILFVYNITRRVSYIPAVRTMSFARHHAVIFVTIMLAALVIYTLVNYFDNGRNLSELHGALTLAYFNSAVTGLIYTAVRYVELERKRKLSEKEHEVTKLTALKTKAELDALHSKVNPHFLYNALNSIADLSITDGKKARRMTIALADLFRYSINYTQNNYSTVNDEVAMTEVYLQIEKIRFEDQLNYTVRVEEEAGHYLVPRFLLQPLVENAVKHGLKATGKMTEILLEVKGSDTVLEINIADNGPLFPDELNPGYGVKSVFDKLDLLFPEQYEIHFRNHPRKQVSILIHKLMKNEPGV